MPFKKVNRYISLMLWEAAAKGLCYFCSTWEQNPDFWTVRD